MYLDLYITFKSIKLAKLCNSKKGAQREWGTEGGDKIVLRLQQMRSANTLADLIRLPQARCHLLHGNLKGYWSIDLAHPYRLIFEPADNPLPTRPDGSIDPARVTAVIIHGVKDTHE